MTDRLLILDAQADLYFGGDGTLSGTVTENGVPGKYRVRLYAQETGLLARETWSDPVTGAYSFPFLSTTIELFVVAFDHTATIQNAAVRDHLFAATPATDADLELGEPVTAGVCPYDLWISAYTDPGGACPYSLRIGPVAVFTADLTVTLDSAATAALGTTVAPVIGALTATLVGATPVFNTNVLPPATVPPAPVTATLALTLVGDTSALAATAHPAGRLAATLSGDTAALEAAYTVLNKAVIQATLADSVMAATGGVGDAPPVFLNTTLANDTTTALGTVVYDVSGTLAVTLDDAVPALAAQQPYFAQAEWTLADDELSLSSATVPVIYGTEVWQWTDSGSLIGWMISQELVSLSDQGSGIIALELTSSDALSLADTGELHAWLVGQDYGALADSGRAVGGLAAGDTLTLTDTGYAQINLPLVSDDTLTLTDSATLHAWRVTSETVTVSESSRFVAALVSADALTLADRGGFVVTASPTSTETVTCTDTGDYRADRHSTETQTITDSGSWTGTPSLIGTDTVTWSESGSAALKQWLVSSDTVTLLDSGASLIAITVAATDDEIVVHEMWGVVGGSLDTGVCWVMNADTLAMSRYTGVPFTQIGMLGDQTIAVGPNGLYRVTGTTDAGAAISAFVETGLRDFGTALLKRMPNATIDYDLAGDLQLTVTWVDACGDRQTATYTVVKEVQGKVKLGRGISFRWCKLRITGTAPWTLYRIDEFPDLLARRLGG